MLFINIFVYFLLFFLSHLNHHIPKIKNQKQTKTNIPHYLVSLYNSGQMDTALMGQNKLIRYIRNKKQKFKKILTIFLTQINLQKPKIYFLTKIVF